MVCVHSIHLLLKYSLFKAGIIKVFKIKKQENIAKSLWKMKLRGTFSGRNFDHACEWAQS